MAGFNGDATGVKRGNLSRRAMVHGGLAAVATLPAAVKPVGAQNIPGVLVDPTKQLIAKMSKSLFGDIGGPLVSGQIFDFLGLGGSHGADYTVYFERIEGKLREMQTQLIAAQQSLDRLTSDVAALGQKVSNVAIQQLLTIFSDNVDVISENFESYRAGVAAIASSDIAQRKAGARQLFQLFDTVNAQNISIALRNIEDAFLPRLAQETGLLTYQPILINDAMNAFSADPNNMKMPPYVIAANPLHKYREVSNNGGVYAYGKILSGSQAIARQMLDTVVADTLRAFVTVQFQGMMLLGSAWLGTINAPKLRTHVDRNKQILAAFAKFPETFLATVDDTIAGLLKKYARPLGAPHATSNELWVWKGQLGLQFTIQTFVQENRQGYPLTNEFIMWDREFTITSKQTSRINLLAMVEKPWQYENCRKVAIAKVMDWFDDSNTRIQAMYMETFGVINLPRCDKTIPKNLSFLSALV